MKDDWEVRAALKVCLCVWIVMIMWACDVLLFVT